MYKVSIRPLQLEDATVSWKWRNDPEIWKYTGQRPDKIITEEIERNWLKEKLQEQSSKRFAILVDDVYVGNIQLTNLTDDKTAQYHIFIGEKSYWGKGIATLASAQLLRYAKYELKLDYIFLHVNPDNQSAIRVYEKLGFYKYDSAIEMRLNLDDLKPPFVSVFMITYNHVQFIQQAVEGVINQRTNFDFELVVGDDCSRDGTDVVLRQLGAEYPGKLRLQLHETNLGAMQNQVTVLNECKGKYVAMCEGDDYWTDTSKLQKQIDALEADDEAVLCFHPMKELHHDGKLYPQKKSVFHRPVSNRSSLLLINFIATLTVVFRNQAYNRSFFEGFNASMGDYIIYLALLHNPKSKIIYLPEYMGVYRYGRPQSQSNAISMEKFHFDFIRILQLASTLPYQWNTFEKACIASSIAREWLNLFKLSMKRKAILNALKIWFKALIQFSKSNYYFAHKEEGFLSGKSFLYHTKMGFSNFWAAKKIETN